MAKHISKVEPGDLVRRISDGSIHLVRSSDTGACQFGLADELPTSMHPWADFEHYETAEVPPATQTDPELPQEAT